MSDDHIRELNRQLAPGLDPKTSVRVIGNPLQKPGHAEILRVVIFPSDDNPIASAGDRRLILDVATLDQLAEVAKHSLTKRVVIHHAGIRVETRCDRSGHIWEVWKLTGLQALPERSLADELMQGTDGNKWRVQK